MSNKSNYFNITLVFSDKNSDKISRQEEKQIKNGEKINQIKEKWRSEFLKSEKIFYNNLQKKHTERIKSKITNIKWNTN